MLPSRATTTPPQRQDDEFTLGEHSLENTSKICELQSDLERYVYDQTNKRLEEFLAMMIPESWNNPKARERQRMLFSYIHRKL
jgi:glutamate synthase domain-containing protein 1